MTEKVKKKERRLIVIAREHSDRGNLGAKLPLQTLLAGKEHLNVIIKEAVPPAIWELTPLMIDSY